MVYGLPGYKERLPDPSLSRHVESYWEVSSQEEEGVHVSELLLPTCTFNLLILDDSCHMKVGYENRWISLDSGVYFCGLRHTSMYLRKTTAFSVRGVRIKPFALSNLLKVPAYNLTDTLHPIEAVFSEVRKYTRLLERAIILPLEEVQPVLNEFLAAFLIQDATIDESLRARCNFIMECKGALKINELLAAFSISKTALRKQFLHKIGIKPKSMCQIWRMNHVLQLAQDRPQDNFTMLSYEAGYYDQSHLIRDFKATLQHTPTRYVKEKHNLIKIEYFNIARRFSNQYDPR